MSIIKCLDLKVFPSLFCFERSAISAKSSIWAKVLLLMATESAGLNWKIFFTCQTDILHSISLFCTRNTLQLSLAASLHWSTVFHCIVPSEFPRKVTLYSNTAIQRSNWLESITLRNLPSTHSAKLETHFS